MNKPNQYFNIAWEKLKRYHPNGKHDCLPNGGTVDLSSPPKVDKKEWARYLEALFDIVIIGKRERWLQMHQDKNGFPVYLYVPHK